MAFMGPDERAAMNDEQNTGGEGEPDVLASEPADENDGKNDSSSRPSKNEIFLFESKKVSERVPLKSFCNYDDFRIQFVLFWVETNGVASDFWELMLFGRDHDLIANIDYDAVCFFAKAHGVDEAFATIWKKQQFIGHSEDNEGLFGNQLRHLYKQDDDPKTIFDSLKVNLFKLQENMVLNLNERGRFLFTLLELTSAVAKQFQKDYPQYCQLEPSEAAIKQITKINPPNKKLLEAQEQADLKEQEYLKDPNNQLRDIQQEQEQLARAVLRIQARQKTLKEKEFEIRKQLKLKELQSKEDKKDKKDKKGNKAKQGKKAVGKPKGKGNFGKGNFCKPKGKK